MAYFYTKDLTVGYNGNVLIHDINVSIDKGKILTLIGPNGAGKSTILKSITRHLEKIGGDVYIGDNEVWSWPLKEMAKSVAVVLTERITPELMTCEDVVAMGRYPYTNVVGSMTEKDRAVVEESLRRVHALDLSERDFSTLSDGQRQRILLARAIAQEPDVIVLDEPTAYLDIRHKIELLDILREMAHEKGITVVMTLHEIDLATKISDYLVCVKGETIAAFGPPDEILSGDAIDRLYDIEHGSYDLLFGSVELTKPKGSPKVFVVAGGGYGAKVFRSLQKKQIPFACGILYDNDVDYRIAKELSDNIVSSPAFECMNENQYKEAEKLMLSCSAVIDAGTPVGSLNALNAKLLDTAKEKGLKIVKDTADITDHESLTRD